MTLTSFNVAIVLTNIRRVGSEENGFDASISHDIHEELKMGLVPGPISVSKVAVLVLHLK